MLYSLGAHLEQLGKTYMHFHLFICAYVCFCVYTYELCTENKSKPLMALFAPILFTGAVQIIELSCVPS